MCAIDALGIPFMLGVPAEVEVVAAGWQAAGDGPTSSTPCRFRNRFASEQRARGYLAERPSLRGEVLSIPEAIEAGRIVFGSLLEHESRPGVE